MKAPARQSDKNSKPAAKATKGRASATTASQPKSSVSKSAPAKPAAKAAAKKPVAAKTKPEAKPVAKKAAPASKKAAPAVKKPAPVSKKAVAPAGKAAAKASAKPDAKAATAAKVKSAAPAKAGSKDLSARKSAKPVATKAAGKPVAEVKMPVQATETPADNKVVVVQDARGEVIATVSAVTPTQGKRAVRKTIMEQMMQPEVVPTHAPDAPKATFTHSTERLMTPPLPTAIKKDPKRANNWKTLSVEELTDQDILAMPDSEYMNDVQQAYFKRKLQLLKADMLANAGETTEHLREDTVVVPDPADRATIEEEHALELRTRDRERKLLKKIEQAIARIDAGDYGYCDETGEPIGVARLMARPTASLSLEAQQRRELKQKMFGD